MVCYITGLWLQRVTDWEPINKILGINTLYPKPKRASSVMNGLAVPSSCIGRLYSKHNTTWIHHMYTLLKFKGAPLNHDHPVALTKNLFLEKNWCCFLEAIERMDWVLWNDMENFGSLHPCLGPLSGKRDGTLLHIRSNEMLPDFSLVYYVTNNDILMYLHTCNAYVEKALKHE